MAEDNKTVVVGMSGGVDSSVAALLLKQQGYRVVGLHMRGENPEQAEEDQKTVKQLCEKMGIELFIEDYSNQMQFVKDYFLEQYKKGRTPNPCVVCNRYVKFKPFIDFAKSIGAQYFATGHYAQIEHNKGISILKKAEDKNKDQTYFLNQLSQKQLSHALFPLGSLTKDQVRKIAEENNLISAHKKDSFDVCFIGSEKFKNYIKNACPSLPGNIVDLETSKVIGKHEGLSSYTLGQRRGLGIGGRQDGTGESWFVTKKDMENNILYVTQGNQAALQNSSLIATNVNWIIEPKENVFECMAKCRYRQEDQGVRVTILENKDVLVDFEKPQRAATPGQYIVFYNKDVCLGGGEINEIK